MNPRGKKPVWKITQKAESDLVEIGAYTESMRGRRQRLKYLGLIEDCFNNLVAKPLSGGDFGYVRAGYCRQRMGEHYVFYRISSDNTVEIIRVIHQRRDVIRHLVDDEGNDL